MLAFMINPQKKKKDLTWAVCKKILLLRNIVEVVHSLDFTREDKKPVVDRIRKHLKKYSLTPERCRAVAVGATVVCTFAQGFVDYEESSRRIKALSKEIELVTSLMGWRWQKIEAHPCIYITQCLLADKAIWGGKDTLQCYVLLKIYSSILNQIALH